MSDKSEENPRHHDHWTIEQVSTFIMLANGGYSGSQIAKELGKTRNAVLGKAHRMKIRLGSSSKIVGEA